jgi:predicted Zn-dependent protease
MRLKPRFLSARVRALFLAGVLCAGLPLQTAVAQVRLPALGESAGDEFSLNTERTLGEQIMREIRRDPAYLDDPALLDYLQRVWQPLVLAAEQRGEITPDTARLLAWEVFLVRDRSVNVFALPGGFVGVHLGLIAMTASSDELAAVLAHELTHVTQRHIARGIVNSQRTTLLSLAGMILGVLAASRAGSTEGVQAAVVGSQAAAVQGQLNYSRDMEREADRVGFGVLTDAGYSPAGMSAMFEKLENANRLNDSGSFPYLRSHPLTVERISEARARIALTGAAVPKNTLEHGLMAARARVLMDTSADSLRRQQQRAIGAEAGGPTPLPPDERMAALYGGALAMLLIGDTAGADAAVTRAQQLLQSRSPADPAADRALRQLQAQVVLQRGDPAGALRLLDAAALQPPSRWTLLLRGQVALAVWEQPRPDGRCGAPGPACTEKDPGYKALRDSNAALQSWLSLHPADPLAWGMLAQGEEALGQRLRAMRAQAEVRAALGDLNGAVDRLRAAQALVRSGAANDFIEASVIDARLRQLDAQRRELAAELRGRAGP